MKVLIVRTFPDILDSSSYNIQEIGLAKALARKEVECGIVLYYGKNKDTIEKMPVECEDGRREITIYRLHGFGILKNGFFPSLHKIIKKYDVVQVHEYDQITSWMYYAFSKKPIVIYHGPYYHLFNKGYNFKCKIFDHTFLKLKCNKKTMCLTKSHAAADFLLEKGFYHVKAVGVGLDSENIEKINPEMAIEKKDKFTLLYVGKIEERRNVFFLLEVFKELEKSCKDMDFLIVGKGEQEYEDRFLNDAEELIRCGKLTYIPGLKQQQMQEIYQKASLMIFPTNYDIFGMVLLEALYYKLPVVSSVNGGADMLIQDGENSLVIPQFEVQKWVETIKDLYSDADKYNKLKSNLQNQDHQKLLWDSKADAFIEFYEQAIWENRKEKK